jgi:hypothetical protein
MEKKNRELGEEGIRPVTPDNRVLETRFRADGDGDEALQERLLECDEEHENRQQADLELFYQRIHEEKVCVGGGGGACACRMWGNVLVWLWLCVCVPLKRLN